jgi:chorismate-pyruvate lyase
MDASALATQRPKRPEVSPLIYPLDEFCARDGRPLPAITSIPGTRVPEPYRSLLVHDQDMTPTLEKFFQRTLHLELLSREQRGDFYFREVVLRLDGTEQPVEFGAIKINLAVFPNAARREILEERLPLGHILAEHRIAHASRPKAFLRVKPDDFINRALRLNGARNLFGRRNTLLDRAQHPIAEIVEILPPVHSRSF